MFGLKESSDRWRNKEELFLSTTYCRKCFMWKRLQHGMLNVLEVGALRQYEAPSYFDG